MERCTRVLISDPEEWKGKWRELMPEAKEVFLELGCGKGRFTAETAAQNPQALYIAVERVPDAMVIAMERLTHPDFLLRYRQVLAEAGEIHFKTDNRDLFEWSLFQFPRVGFGVSEVTRDLHADGIHGVMTDYEEKFHNLGTPINRCLGTMGPLPEVPEPPAEE